MAASSRVWRCGGGMAALALAATASSHLHDRQHSRQHHHHFHSLSTFAPMSIFSPKVVLCDTDGKKSSKTYEIKIDAPQPALSPSEFRSFRLASKTRVNHNTSLYRFQFDHPNAELGMSVASCMVISAPVDGKEEVRPYTPVSPQNARGYMDLIIKTYAEGKISKHMASLSVGDSVSMKGPFEKIKYERNMKKAIGMIAGGTGLTPMLQLIRHILADPRDKTEIRLLFANETESDILLRQELDALAALYPNFKVYYTISQPGDKWQGFTGFVNKAMVAETMPPPDEDHLIMVCGPPAMVAALAGPKDKAEQGPLDGLLKLMQYKPDQVFKF